MSRVLSTEEAKAAINNIQNIISGGLTDQINNLNREGSTLSQRDVWDGPLAAQFRDVTWPETSAALSKARTELEELQRQLQQIAQDIFTAGGGS